MVELCKRREVRLLEAERKIRNTEMCGIAGFFEGDIETEELKSMISQLRHRGPDGFGLYHKDGIGLAHARLSIIDLNGGFQPIHNEDKTIWIVFNGEIFNYIELRFNLELLGHKFYTRTDTEVIVHAYEEWGETAFSQFNGQFSFALWNERRKEGYLVRDRVGIQPLFFTARNQGMYFASEIKSLLAICKFNEGLDRDQIANILTFWTTAPGQTVFKNIFELHPGHYLKYNWGGSLQIKEYWNHEYSTEREGNAYEIYKKLADACKIRLRSDVPVGAYLSGGLDSSIIASMVKTHFNNDLHTFSIEFEDGKFDESSYQRLVAKELGVKHTRFKCSQEDIAGAFETVIHHTEKPVMRTAPVPLYLLSKRVREEGYSVVLTGEGADEVFGGYDIFRENYVRRYIREHGDTENSRKLLLQLYPWMKDRISGSPSFLRKFFDSDIPSSSPYFSHEPRWRTSSKASKFFAEGMPSPSGFDDFAERFAVPEGATSLQKAQYLEFHTLFNGYLISSQGDRMLMANGVEGRFPFLDPNVINYANSMRDNSKISGMNEKFILKKMARDLIPNQVIDRKKQPYMAPDGSSFVNQFTTVDYVNEVLSPNTVADYGQPLKKEVRERKRQWIP
jgi:asparagine synthase (glutamine-hydrolysing)